MIAAFLVGRPGAMPAVPLKGPAKSHCSTLRGSRSSPMPDTLGAAACQDAATIAADGLPHPCAGRHAASEPEMTFRRTARIAARPDGMPRAGAESPGRPLPAGFGSNRRQRRCGSETPDRRTRFRRAARSCLSVQRGRSDDVGRSWVKTVAVRLVLLLLTQATPIPRAFSIHMKPWQLGERLGSVALVTGLCNRGDRWRRSTHGRPVAGRGSTGGTRPLANEWAPIAALIATSRLRRPAGEPLGGQSRTRHRRSLLPCPSNYSDLCATGQYLKNASGGPRPY